MRAHWLFRIVWTVKQNVLFGRNYGSTKRPKLTRKFRTPHAINWKRVFGRRACLKARLITCWVPQEDAAVSSLICFMSHATFGRYRPRCSDLIERDVSDISRSYLFYKIYLCARSVDLLPSFCPLFTSDDVHDRP